jgi:ABC-2 type transport system permease protein
MSTSRTERRVLAPRAPGRGIGRFAHIYSALFRISVLGQIQYRASGIIWMLGSILEPIIFLVVWSAVADSQGGEVRGFTAHTFAAYYVLLFLVNHLTFAWVMHTFEYRIQFGQLAFELLRPIHPIHTDLADNLAYKLVMMIVMLPALVVMWLLFDPEFHSTWADVGLFVIALVLALGIRFLFEWTLALAAFWTTRVSAVNQVYFSVLMFLSGRVAPMAMFPIWLQDVAHSLPFYWMVAFPVEVGLGRVPSGEVVGGFGTQLLWLVGALVVIRGVWRFSVKRFTAVGS